MKEGGEKGLEGYIFPKGEKPHGRLLVLGLGGRDVETLKRVVGGGGDGSWTGRGGRLRGGEFESSMGTTATRDAKPKPSPHPLASCLAPPFSGHPLFSPLVGMPSPREIVE